jgi:hypothetical protein
MVHILDMLSCCLLENARVQVCLLDIERRVNGRERRTKTTLMMR